MIRLNLEGIEVRKIAVLLLSISMLYSFQIRVVKYLELYKLNILIATFFVFVIMVSRKQYFDYIKSSADFSLKMWSIIFFWGLYLGLGLGIMNGSIIDYLSFYICLPFAIIVYSFLFDKMKYKVMILYVFYIYSIILSLLGLYESITGNIFYVTYGIEKNVLGLYVPNTIFYNSNDFAIFMTFSIFLAYILAEYAKPRKRIISTALFLFGSNILLTDCRGAILGMVIYLYLIYIVKLMKRHKIIAIIITIPVAMLLVSWIITFMDTSDMNTKALGGRAEIWKVSLEQLKGSNYIGTGPGNTDALNSISSSRISKIGAVHSFFLEMLCDTGIIGGISVLFWYYKLLKNSIKFSNKRNSSYLIMAILIAFLPMSVSCSTLIHDKPFVIYFFATIIAEQNQNEKRFFNELNMQKGRLYRHE